MKIYRLADGFTVFAKNDDQFVDRLFKRSYMCVETNTQDYMSGFAKRSLGLYGIRIRSFNPTIFVRDLIEHGIITSGYLN